MFRFKHETDEQVRERLLKLCKEGDYGMCPPPMEANVAISELRDFFLGQDWYASFPIAHKPSISETVYQIKKKYRFRFCREYIGKMLTSSKKVNSNTCPPEMDADSAINELRDFFLGKGWYVSLSIGHEQVISEIVYQIEISIKKTRSIFS